ncbi:MAG: M24 family metallopeptidase [Thermoanaerobaculia bacterium]|nr:M24 family metallopeptidase [Thermoanaerobaculia bacterium]
MEPLKRFGSTRREPLAPLPFAVAVALAALLLTTPLTAQEAKRRWETMNQIRRDKFDLVLPEAMRENAIDMWIVQIREANYEPLWPDLGFGYTGQTGYYVFTDRGGERIERAALGISGYMIERSGAYDYFGSADELAAFVAERDPERIGLNISRSIGGADGLSHSGYLEIVELLGEPWASRLVSAEKLVSDFRSRRVASEIAAFAEAGEISRQIAERSLSNEVITPGVTTLEDVAWWIRDRLFERGLDLSFGMPSIYVTGPEGIEAISSPRIIQRGDLLMIDWGVGLMNLYTDMKRIAYVLRAGETEAPAGIGNAFDRAVEARQVVRGAIRAGITAKQAEEEIYAALAEAGFERIEFNQPTDDPDTTDVVIGCHSVGNSGHGIGPSIAFFNPVRITYELRPTNLLSIELFAYTAAPEWGGKKVRIPLEDDAVVTERGVEWLYPVNDRILLIK